jgi:hypothetical protein
MSSRLVNESPIRTRYLNFFSGPISTSGPYGFHLPDTPARRERRYQGAQAELRRLASLVYGVEVSVEVRAGPSSSQRQRPPSTMARTRSWWGRIATAR